MLINGKVNIEIADSARHTKCDENALESHFFPLLLSLSGKRVEDDVTRSFAFVCMCVCMRLLLIFTRKPNMTKNEEKKETRPNEKGKKKETKQLVYHPFMKQKRKRSTKFVCMCANAPLSRTPAIMDAFDGT